MPSILFLVQQAKTNISTKVRVINYLKLFDKNKIKYNIVSYFSNVSTNKYFHYSLYNGLITLYNKVYSLLAVLRIFLQINKFDFLFIQKVMPPILFLKLIFRIKSKKTKIIFDIDDAIYLLNHERFNFLIDRSDIIFVKNSYIKKLVSNYNSNVYIVPSCIDINKFDNIQSHPGFKFSFLKRLFSDYNSSDIIIGWIGSPSTENHLYLIANPLIKLLKTHKNVKLLLAGVSEFSFTKSFFDEILETKIFFNYDESLMLELLSCIDIGIMPLFNNEDSYSRGSFKILNYWAAKVPVIRSNVGYKEDLLIEHNINGFLANDEYEWLKYFTLLVDSSNLRNKFGQEGFRITNENYNILNSFKLIISILFSK